VIVACAVAARNVSGQQPRPQPIVFASRHEARTQFRAALADAQQNGKLVLLDFGASWCPECRSFEKVLAAPEVQRYLAAHFNVVHVSSDRWSSVLWRYDDALTEGIPAAVVLTPDGRVLRRENGAEFSDKRESAGTFVVWLTSLVANTVPPDSIVAPPRPVSDGVNEYWSAPPPVDTAQLESFAETLSLVAPAPARANPVDRAATRIILRLMSTADSAVSGIDVSRGDTVLQHVVARHDPRTLRPLEILDQNARDTARLSYDNGRVRGIEFFTDSGDAPDTLFVDAAVAGNTIDRRNLWIVLPRLSLEPKQSFVVTQFDSWTHLLYPIHIHVSQSASLALRTGTFDAYRLDLSGAVWNLPQTWYVSVAAPRRILRLELADRSVYEVSH